jgi:hypothetical protein
MKASPGVAWACQPPEHGDLRAGFEPRAAKTVGAGGYSHCPQGRGAVLRCSLHRGPLCDKAATRCVCANVRYLRLCDPSVWSAQDLHILTDCSPDLVGLSVSSPTVITIAVKLVLSQSFGVCWAGARMVVVGF